jgi:hypothetical protein
MFKRARYDRALELSEGIANATPPNSYTLRAGVLRSVILGGEITAYKQVAEAYEKGLKATKVSKCKDIYMSSRHDFLQTGGHRALELAEVAQHLTTPGPFPKEIVLEAPYPSNEGPTALATLGRVSGGLCVDENEQEQVAVDAPLMGVSDALADVVGGDRSAARTKLQTGSVNLDPGEFALYLVSHLLDGARIFDNKHLVDPVEFKTMMGQADATAQAAAALLKQTPDPAKQDRLKKFQQQIKTEIKTGLSLN